MTDPRRETRSLLLAGAALLALSAFHPSDWPTWWLEVTPILIVVPILIATYRRHPFTPVVYRLVLIHAAILMLGAHYSYAEVPLGFWVRDALGLARNHYDRLGHFAQGFVPALLVRDVLLRSTPLRRGGWLFFLVTAVCLAMSAAYEWVEWWVAILFGEGATAFLGTQGDPWDTQWDMLICTIGAILSQILLASTQDREMAEMDADPGRTLGAAAGVRPTARHTRRRTSPRG
jgi:putative membrane protein